MRVARALLAASALFALASTAACGRKATEADCDLILDRNVEVAMQQLHISDPTAIAKRKAEIRAEMKDSVKECVGKRITDGMLACVRRASTADDIDRCMR